MNISSWKIFDKKGSNIGWSSDPLIQLVFDSPTGKGAEGFLITDVSGIIRSSKITNGGYLYDTPGDITLSYSYALDNGLKALTSSDASIEFIDVSIFNPDPLNTKSISDVKATIDSSLFSYPSVTYASAIFLEPISVGLVETEHLYILEEPSSGYYIRPYDSSNNILVFELIGDDNEISFFETDENTSEITWTNSLVYDVSAYTVNTPIQLNIGFRSEFEGVFERILRVYHLVGDTLFTLADIIVNAEAVGEDERFRALIADFGLPDPKDIQQIFKETDINEDLPDWQILNYKSKHIILEHDKIIPFIGTYKGLINAIKWLGYDDIFVREWFLNVKENTKLSLIVPFDAVDRRKTILKFNVAERKTLKKLNQLSLNYCITRETGEIDVWGTPETENCYSYNIKEVFIKLMGLKQWLEKNIIGINCRITDITGEGVYFERIQNLIYATNNIGYDYSVEQSLTPYGIDHDSELISGNADIRLTFLELTQTTTNDLPMTFGDMTAYAWHPDTPLIYYSLNDPSYLANPDSFILVGSSFQYPFINIADIMWRLSVEKTDAGVLGVNVITNPLLIYENEIRFYNTFDTSSIFFNASTNLTIFLEKAYLRDPSIDEWGTSIAYSIYPSVSDNYDYDMESSLGVVTSFNGYVTFLTNALSKLEYAVDTNYKVPLLKFQNFRYSDSNGITQTFGNKEYILDILDGKIYMDTGLTTNSSDNLELYLNFNYDTSLNEQQITVNAVYESPRMRLFQFDPSAYYWADPSGKTGGNNPNVYITDNSIYTMHVNHSGDYNIELFAWDEYNTMFYNPTKEKYPVWIKTPTIYTLIDNCCNNICVSTYMSINEVSTLINNNLYPIYDRFIPLQGLSLTVDTEGYPYINVPSITYFQDVPEPNSINRFYNLTERVLSIVDSSIVIDSDFQKFYVNDDIKLVKFDKGKYSLITEVSSHITAVSGTTLRLDKIPTSITIDSSADVYLLNDTYRTTVNASNGTGYLGLDVSGYAFNIGQLTGIIVTDTSMSGYSWGSSYRVLTVNGSMHTFDYKLPEIFLNNPTKYTVQIKHAYSTFADFSIPTSSATEINNEFKIYFTDSYCQEYYLDNTFIMLNILFDQEIVNDQWYNPSDNLTNNTFYYYTQPITIDISTLVILKAIYDSSTYLLNQKNIWQVINHDTSTILFKVFNSEVPYIFNETGTYDIECAVYDSFGNTITKKYEGLVKVE